MIGKTIETTGIDQPVHRLERSAGIHEMNSGVLLIEGTDSREFLHRMSTNDFATLQKGEARTTVLVNEKARIVDVVNVFNQAEGLLLVTSAGTSSVVQEWLQRFIILEDVRITDLTPEYATLLLIGANLGQHVEQVGLPFRKLPEGRNFIEGKIATGMLILTNDNRWQFPGCVFVAPKTEIQRVSELAQEMSHDAGSGVFFLTDEPFDELRIEQGIPEYGLELTNDVNPLEAGLEGAINSTKGCYIGQEVIARLETYKKLQRRLSGFIFPRTGDEPRSTGTLFRDQEEVGWTTSHCYSRSLGHPVALGYLNTGVQSTALEFRASEGETVQPVQVSKLPFAAK